MGIIQGRRPRVEYKRELIENAADAAIVLSPDLGDDSTFLQSAPLTGTRLVTLPTNAFAGQRLHCVRDAGATGGDNLDIGGLKILEVGEWCSLTYDGTNWILVAFGTGVT